MTNNQVNGTWTVAEGVHEDFPLIIRYKSVNEDLVRAITPQLVRICWKFTADPLSGLPDPQSLARLQKFEELLDRNIDLAGAGTLCAVITNNGTRDFYFYTADVQRFIDCFHNIDQETEPYPIHLEVTADDNGAFYFDIVDSCS